MEAAVETLWPTRCAVCDVPGEILCEKCAAQLRFIDVNGACPTCGAPYGRAQCTECNDTVMALQGRKHPPMDAMTNCVILDNDSRRVVTSFKDQGEQRLAKTIAEYLARYLNPTWIEERATITYIPATKAAIRRRGFDHMNLVAAELANITGLKLVRLFTHPTSKDQRRLSRAERSINMESKISILDGCQIPYSCIVVDDICTTGATLYAATDALKRAGCTKVYTATFGRVLDI